MWKIKKKKQIFLDIIIILCWMGIVFIFSNQIGKVSTNLSGNITSKIIDVFHKNDELTKKEKTALYNKYHYFVRKLAHYTIYLIGGMVIISFIDSLTSKKWLSILLTILFGFIYALSDEIHQYFVLERDARFADVLIDTAGVITGVVLYIVVVAIVKKIRNHRKSKNIKECI